MANLLPKLFDHPFFKDSFDMMDFPVAKIGKSDLPNLNYEVYKEGNNFIAIFNMPGHSGMDDIKADVNKETGLLTVESKLTKEEKEEKEGRVYYHKGETSSSYAFYLPEDVDLETACATCENGQLKIKFNLIDESQVAESKTLSIPIETLGEKA